MTCCRCKKRMAVVFVTRVENKKPINEGYCLVCAKELGLAPVDDIIKNMGISPDEVENISDELTNLANGEDDGESGFNPGGAATFPFLQNLFGQQGNQSGKQDERGSKTEEKPKEKKKEEKRKYLDMYCHNLSQKAAEGKIDNIVGREKELARVIQILNRRTKNNPCLIGEPGVGKTAIAEGLAQKIYRNEVPARLSSCEVHLLDLTAMVAGTQFRGQFESRIKGLIDEVKKLGNIILFIDEVHNLVGAGDAEGSMNAANILKPALSRGEIQVIGATTLVEYRKHIEKDAALERRFQPVIVNEPSVDETIEVLRGIKGHYEKYHSVKIPDQILVSAAQMSERYITDRYLPDKAIDLIDESASLAALSSAPLNKLIIVNKELDSLNAENDSLVSDEQNEQVFQRLAEIKARRCQLEDEKTVLSAEADKTYVTLDQLSKVIEMWTGIPAQKVKEEEYENLSGLSGRLKKRIVGQDEAIDLIAMSIKRSRVGISPVRRPVSFIFAGPTGVGKTALVKELAADLFTTPDSLIRLDMSEFMEKYAVSRIVGSPPGYVGYDEAGQLTEKVRRRPYSVILFDEIEKAHPDVLNILLQILDEGRITDAHGRVVSFENTVIVMTTNAGSQVKSSAGFNSSNTAVEKERTLKALETFLRPEFINRVDEIVTFNRLTKENFSGICDIMLGELADVLKKKGIALSYDAAVRDFLTEKGYSVQYGARNLRRLIQKQVEDKIVNLLLSRYNVTTTEISLSVADNDIKVDIS